MHLWMAAALSGVTRDLGRGLRCERGTAAPTNSATKNVFAVLMGRFLSE